MDMRWEAIPTQHKAKLRLHGEGEFVGRRSYLGYVIRRDSGEWKVVALESYSHPAVRSVDGELFSTEEEAREALQSAMALAWISASEEERENIWD